MDLTSAILVLAQEPPPQAPDALGGMLLPMVLVFVFIYFFMIRPQRREQQQKQKLLESLKKNDRVITNGGMYGTIVNVKDDEVTLRVDDQAKVKIRFLKSAIARLAPTGSSGSSETEDGSQKKS